MAEHPDRPLNPWIPERDPIRLAILGKLVEELTECASAAARCMIQGIEGSEPTTGKPNHQWLFEELADVAAVCSIAFDHFSNGDGRAEHTLDERMDAKVDHLNRWHELIRAKATPLTEASAFAAGGPSLVATFLHQQGERFRVEGGIDAQATLEAFAAFAVDRLKARAGIAGIAAQVTEPPVPDATSVVINLSERRPASAETES